MATYKISYKSNNNYSKISNKKNKSNGIMGSKNTYAEACNNHKENNSSSKSQKALTTEKQPLPKLQCMSRIASLPLVVSGIDVGGKLYSSLKESNALTKWSLTKAESSLLAYLNLAMPAVELFSGPINKIDKLVCKSLDIVEERVPLILYLPPELIYENAQDYMNNRIVRPVLKRAESMKQMGNAVLDSRMTIYAADTVDSVLHKADIYVDKYLPGDEQDTTEKSQSIDEKDGPEEPRQHVVRAVKHADRLSRKLGRRLSRRTVLEAKALKEQTSEAINVLVYIAELVVTDPKLAYQKAKELWAELSKDEPGNQARPETLEQLIALLTRETARRMVHLINYTTSKAVKLPRKTIRSIRNVSQEFLIIANTIIQKVDLKTLRNTIVNKAVYYKSQLEKLLQELQKRSQIILEQLALLIAGGSQTRKQTRCHLRNNHLFYDINATINGVNP